MPSDSASSPDALRPDAARPSTTDREELLVSVVLAGRSGVAGADGIPDRTLRDLGWESICDRLADACTSPMGAEVARSLGFLPSEDLVTERSAEVAEAMQLAVALALPSLRSAESVVASVGRARRGQILEGRELLSVGRTAAEARRLRSELRARADLPRIASHAARLHDLRALAQQLVASIDPSGELRDAEWPELARARRKVLALRNAISDRLQKILRSPRYEGILQDDFVTIRDERYVVPVRAGERGDFPGIVHGHSNSGASLFIEPEEIVGLNNEFRMAQLDVEQETRRILAELTERVAAHAPELEANESRLAYLDITFAVARAAIDESWTLASLPLPRATVHLELRNAAHPVLAMRARAGEIELVRNTIQLTGRARLLVISGPNTGGKTVTLKTVGLAALMLRAGLPVSAGHDSVVPFFRRVYCDIGDDQAIERDLSTFSAHLRNLTSFLPDCDGDSLVLLDELFAGTDPEQGAALGHALLEDLARRGSTVVVTTHLDPLKTLSMEDERFASASVAFDMDRLVPTWKLRMGIPGSSYALRIAERLGLSRRIVQRAGEVLAEGASTERETLIARLADEHQRLESLRDEMERRERVLAREEARVAAALREVAERGRKELDATTRSLLEEMRALQKRVRTLERAPAPQDSETHRAWLEDARQTVRDVEARMRREDAVRAEKEESVPTRTAVAVGALQVGDVVWVRPFARNGTVTEVARPDRVVVQVGTMRASFAPDELAVADREEMNASTGRSVRRSATVAVVRTTERNPSQTLDLRGCTADDAIEQLEAWLDRAVSTEQASLVVIHGHGTGVLKRSVRDALAATRYSLRFRPGERGEGGDGVTVVELYDAPSPSSAGP